MHKLKKRRPSVPDSQRPLPTPSIHSSPPQLRVDRIPLKLNDVAISRGDFRGSTIIAG